MCAVQCSFPTRCAEKTMNFAKSWRTLRGAPTGGLPSRGVCIFIFIKCQIRQKNVGIASRDLGSFLSHVREPHRSEEAVFRALPSIRQVIVPTTHPVCAKS